MKLSYPDPGRQHRLMEALLEPRFLASRYLDLVNVNANFAWNTVDGGFETLDLCRWQGGLQRPSAAS